MKNTSFQKYFEFDNILVFFTSQHQRVVAKDKFYEFRKKALFN